MVVCGTSIKPPTWDIREILVRISSSTQPQWRRRVENLCRELSSRLGSARERKGKVAVGKLNSIDFTT